MIFVTLGSQKFQFDRLLRKIDELIDQGIITEEVFAQIGSSGYIPQNFKYTRFMDREEFAEFIQNASLVITHGGTGVIIGAVKKGKRLLRFQGFQSMESMWMIINCNFFINLMILASFAPATIWRNLEIVLKRFKEQSISPMYQILRQLSIL